MAKGRINIVIAGDASQLNKAMAQSERRMRKFGRNLQSIGDTVFRSIGVPFIAAGAAGVKAAMDFESSMSKIKGLVGITGQDFKDLESAALRLGPQMGKSANEAAEALFFITSAGLKGNDAIETLEASLKASAAGLGDTKVVADLATSAMNAYGSDTLSAAQATDILTAAVREGKLEADTLAGSMGRVLPIASAMGVQFNEVGAAFAAMSRTGTNADEAATQLKAILTTIAKPAKESEKALNAMGLSSEVLQKQLEEKGLLSVLTTLSERFKGNTAATAAVFGNVRALTGVLDLMGKNAQTTTAIFGDMADTVGDNEKAFAAAAETTQFKFNQALAQLNAAAIKLGRDLIPMVTDVVESIQKAVHWFTSLDDSTRKLIVSVLKWTTVLSAGASVVGRVVVSVANLSRALRGLGLAKAIAGFAGLAKTGTTANIAIRMLGIGLKSLLVSLAPVAAGIAAIVVVAETLPRAMQSKSWWGDQARNLFIHNNVIRNLTLGYYELKGAIFGANEELDDSQKALYADAQAQLDAWKAKEQANLTIKQLTESIEGLGGAYSDTVDPVDKLRDSIQKLAYEEQVFGKNLTDQKISAYEGAIRELIEMGFTPASDAVKNLKAELDALYASIIKVERLPKIAKAWEIETPKFKGISDAFGESIFKGMGLDFGEMQGENRLEDEASTIFSGDLFDAGKVLEKKQKDINAIKESLNQASEAGQQFGNMLMDAFGSSATAAEAMGKILLKVASEVVLGNLMTALSGWINKTFQTLGPWGVPLAAAGFGVITALMGRAKGFKSGVPQMAEGGILTGPTMLQAGEYPGARVNPEVIAPLDKLKSMLGGNTVNVTGEFRVRGTDLIVTLERANRIKQNERGYGLNG